MLTKLVCPACRVEIVPHNSGAACPQCAREFPCIDGILCFLDPDEVFNPGEFEPCQKQEWSNSAQLRDRIRGSRLLSLINRLRIGVSLSGRRDRVFSREMRRGDRRQLILDVGCGGGRHYFCNYGQVVGIDPVRELLRISQQIYAEVHQASALRLPFAEGTFDYVVSSDVIGHIPEPHKDQLFGEMFRVLKGGGRTVHVIETDSVNCWFRVAHRHPDLFQEHFVERPGHIGLELPTRLRERFRKHGFREIAFKRIAGNVQACGTLSGFFDNAYKEREPWLAFLVAVDRWLSKRLVIQELLNLVLEPLARVDDLLAPLDHASGALVVFEKPSA